MLTNLGDKKHRRATRSEIHADLKLGNKGEHTLTYYKPTCRSADVRFVILPGAFRLVISFPNSQYRRFANGGRTYAARDDARDRSTRHCTFVAAGFSIIVTLYARLTCNVR